MPGDTGRYRPSRRPRVRAQDRPGSPFGGPQRRRSPLVLPLPSNVKLKVTPDDSLKSVDVQEKVGEGINYRDPSRMSFEDYAKFQFTWGRLRTEFLAAPTSISGQPARSRFGREHASTPTRTRP